MIYMLCRNRVRDFATWKGIFDSHAEAHAAAGLDLVGLWRGLENPNNVFFLFKVENLEKARAFVNAPEGAQARKASGVIDGEIHFLEEGEGY